LGAQWWGSLPKAAGLGHGVGGMSVVEVAIGYGGTPGRFRVEVRSPSAGEASAEMSLDVGALLAGRAQFQQTLLVSGVPSRQVLTKEESAIRETGRALNVTSEYWVNSDVHVMAARLGLTADAGTAPGAYPIVSWRVCLPSSSR